MNVIEVYNENDELVAYIDENGTAGGSEADQFIQVPEMVEPLIEADIEEGDTPAPQGCTIYWKRSYGFHYVHLLFTLDGYDYSQFKAGIEDGEFYRTDCPADQLKVVFCDGTDLSHTNQIRLKGPGTFYWNDYQQNTVDPNASPEVQAQQAAADQAVNWSTQRN